jgi:hypothetical protein
MAALWGAALLWCSTALGPGCGSQDPTVEACTAACRNRVAGGCPATCDCSKCVEVPASCQGQLDCAAGATSCGVIYACSSTLPPECGAFFFGTVCP